MVKNKVIQFRLSETEYFLINSHFKNFHKNSGLKISKSDFIRFCLSRATNTEFLYQIGYLSYQDLMETQLFNKTKYRRLKKCKK